MIPNIKKIQQSKEAKVLIGNFFSLSILKLIGYIFPLITLPYLSRVIGVDSFGEIAFALSIVVYFETVVNYGFSYTATRDIAQNRDDKEVVSQIFSLVFFSKLLLLALSTIVFSICVYSIPFLREKNVLMWLTFLYVPATILFPDWFFQAMERMKYITIMNVLSKFLFTILVFVVITKKTDYIFQPLLMALGYWLSGLISMIIIVKRFDVKIIVPSLKQVLQAIKNSSNMFVSLFLPNLYTNYSVILLGSISGSFATGIFSSGKKFSDLSDQLTQVLSRTFFPFLARRIDKHNMYVKIAGGISLFMVFILFFGADVLVKIFYTEEFAPAVLIIQILSVTPFFLFLMNTYGTNYLVLIGKEHVLRNIVLFCSVIGFVVSTIAVLKYSYVGVAFVFVLIWGIRGIMTWYYANKIKKNI